ncbi:MAG: Asp-tRNA(Asn)/Glu-tRNA(Gln) amidotransferase subunit GatB [Alcaligenaceae bacterium]|nr:Asp-tRNA(Asn)/Glu-tRNA(Gln) amidotransferase subunit GatB [Alcaligenaceae bacterium]
MKWEVVIGLETHVQLSTKAKVFSGSSTAFGAEPNTQANEVDMALPGSLPVLNRGAVRKAVQFGLATGADIALFSKFERKNYFYPDLPKNYQITQLEIPIVQGGQIHYMLDGEERVLNLTRAHMEEDAGKSLHEDFIGWQGEKSTGIDLNRTGTPLLEIVTEPDLRSAQEAVAYVRALHNLVVWLGICDGNMQEGSFRCDANVSIRPIGQKAFGTRTEIKNVNSFRFLERAIEYEIQRQIELIEDGGTVVQETRLYDDALDETRSMRTKEDAQDYRYFPDPDLPPLIITQAWVDEIASEMPELPKQRQTRYMALGLTAYDAEQITQTRATADFFDDVLIQLEQPKTLAKTLANVFIGDLAASLNRAELNIGDCPIGASSLAMLVRRMGDNTLSSKTAKKVFQALWDGESTDVDHIIEKQGLKQISDTGAITTMIHEVLAKNPATVEQYHAGKDKAFNSLVGQVMKASRGKANPAQVNQLLKEILG